MVEITGFYIYSLQTRLTDVDKEHIPASYIEDTAHVGKIVFDSSNTVEIGSGAGNLG